MDRFALWLGVTILVVSFLAWLAQTIREVKANRAKPVENIRAQVVAKRTSVSGGGRHMTASTNYYVTFEYQDESREEFPLSGKEYGLLAEGDLGFIRRQGTWFLGFERTIRKGE